MSDPKFSIGDHVRLTGEFLRNTGQYSGRETLSVWIVRACDCELCKRGDFVCTNEGSSFEGIEFRHIRIENLERARRRRF